MRVDSERCDRLLLFRVQCTDMSESVCLSLNPLANSCELRQSCPLFVSAGPHGSGAAVSIVENHCLQKSSGTEPEVKIEVKTEVKSETESEAEP